MTDGTWNGQSGRRALSTEETRGRKCESECRDPKEGSTGCICRSLERQPESWSLSSQESMKPCVFQSWTLLSPRVKFTMIKQLYLWAVLPSLILQIYLAFILFLCLPCIFHSRFSFWRGRPRAIKIREER